MGYLFSFEVLHAPQKLASASVFCTVVITLTKMPQSGADIGRISWRRILSHCDCWGLCWPGLNGHLMVDLCLSDMSFGFDWESNKFSMWNFGFSTWLDHTRLPFTDKQLSLIGWPYCSYATLHVLNVLQCKIPPFTTSCKYKSSFWARL